MTHSVHSALLSLRAQLAELDELGEDEETTALRQELLDAIREAGEAAAEEDGDVAAEYSAAFRRSDGMHPRNRHVDARKRLTRVKPSRLSTPRGRYANAPPDFASLAQKQPVLRPFLSTDAATGRASLDFTDFSATRALTAALLKEDFGLTWWLPEGHLCPTLTSRCNYLLWVEDLIALMPPHHGGTAIRGVDIGTGASAIYALLGAAAHGWSFVATDVTDEALYWARRNVDANPHVKGLIEVRDARVDAYDQASWPLLAGVLKEGDSFAFTVSNPPFFEYLSEAGQNPGTACGGTASEMVYPGGEAAFIAAHMTDSQLPHIRSAVSWFTTLCGKKATLRTMVDALRAARAPAVRTACFRQGKTTRWGLAWSWMPEAEATQSTPLPVAPPPTKTHTATPAATLPRPCTRASFQLRFSAKDVGAPAAILAALHAALATHSSVRSCTCDTATFTVAGVLNCSSDMDDGQRAAKKRHIDGDSGRAAPFSAAVQRSSQCSVTVTIQLLAGPSRQSGPAQVALAQIARAVESTLTAQWRAE